MTYITLDKADGPECPYCGCRETELLKGTDAGTWFGGRQLSRPMRPLGDGQFESLSCFPPEHATQGTAVCGHCGRRFTIRLNDGPVEPVAADVLYSDPEPIVDEPAEIAEDLVAAKKVPMPRLHCPKCKSVEVIVRSTKKAKPPSTRTWRNHFCRACEYTFQSYEETEEER